MGGQRRKFNVIIGSHNYFRNGIAILGIFIITSIIFGLAKFYEGNSFYILSSDGFIALQILLEFLAIIISFAFLLSYTILRNRQNQYPW